MRALSPRESRLLAVLVLIAALMLVDVLVVAPVLDGFSDRAAQRADLTARYAANDRVIAAIPRLRRTAARRDAQTAQFVAVAPDAGTASGSLRDRVQALASRVGGDFRGGEDVSAPPGMVATRVSLRLGAGQLAQLLALLQNSRPLVVVTGLSVSADDALVSGTASTLDVSLDVAIPFRPAAAR